jgi:hypothetical protein
MPHMQLNPEQQTFYDKVVDLSFSKLLLLGALESYYH